MQEHSQTNSNNNNIGQQQDQNLNEGLLVQSAQFQPIDSNIDGQPSWPVQSSDQQAQYQCHKGKELPRNQVQVHQSFQHKQQTQYQTDTYQNAEKQNLFPQSYYQQDGSSEDHGCGQMNSPQIQEEDSQQQNGNGAQDIVEKHIGLVVDDYKQNDQARRSQSRPEEYLNDQNIQQDQHVNPSIHPNNSPQEMASPDPEPKSHDGQSRRIKDLPQQEQLPNIEGRLKDAKSSKSTPFSENSIICSGNKDATDQNGENSLQQTLNEILSKPRKDSDIKMDVAFGGQKERVHGKLEAAHQRRNETGDEQGYTKAIPTKKRMRKRASKSGVQQVEDLSPSPYNNLQRAETKVYQEDKVRQEIAHDVDGAILKGASLQLQKFQTQIGSSKFRSASRVNQNFAENSPPLEDWNSKPSPKEILQPNSIAQQHRMGRWTKDEHFRFLVALKLYGKEWRKVQEHVITRTSTQARSHAQKFFQKLEKRNQILEEFLEALDVNNLEKHCIMSDLEDEGAPIGGPRNKSNSRKRPGNRTNRNTTLLIPDVVALKQRQKNDCIVAEPQSAQKSHPTNKQSLDRDSSNDQPSSPQNTPQISKENNKTHLQQQVNNTTEQVPSLKLEINDNHSSPNEPANDERSGSSPVLRVDNQIGDKSGSLSAQQTLSPVQQQEIEQSKGSPKLLAKRTNSHVKQESSSEFQQPLPKKSFQPPEAPMSAEFDISAEKRKRAASTKNLRPSTDIPRRQLSNLNNVPHASPMIETQKLDKNYPQPINSISKNIQNIQMTNYQVVDAKQPTRQIDTKTVNLFNIGANAIGNTSAPIAGHRYHSNSISIPSTQPPSSLVPQKYQSTMGINNEAMQHNSQMSAGLQHNINNQFPMTPQLRHSAASVVNYNHQCSDLGFNHQNYSLISQISNPQYMQMKQGKERPRANSFDEQFFNNILDKDEDVDELDEGVILPEIHKALVNKAVNEKLAPGVESKYITETEAIQQGYARLNLTPKPKYPTHSFYNMMAAHNSASQNTLGFDDGLNRMRSNIRRVDSCDQFAVANNVQPIEQQQRKQQELHIPRMNEHLICQDDLKNQINQQMGIQESIPRQIPTEFLIQQAQGAFDMGHVGISSLLQANSVQRNELVHSLLQNNHRTALLEQQSNLEKQILQLQQHNALQLDLQKQLQLSQQGVSLQSMVSGIQMPQIHAAPNNMSLSMRSIQPPGNQPFQVANLQQIQHNNIQQTQQQAMIQQLQNQQIQQNNESWRTQQKNQSGTSASKQLEGGGVDHSHMNGTYMSEVSQTRSHQMQMMQAPPIVASSHHK